MRLVTTPICFTYRILHVPKGAQKQRPALVRGTDTAVIRHVEPDEAVVAFRVKRPRLDAWPFMFPRKARRAVSAANWIRKAFNFEVLLFENVLWWPYLDRDYSGAGQSSPRSANDCLKDLEADQNLFDMPEIDGSRDVFKEAPESRKLIETNYGDKLAISQRKAYENFLICADGAYVRGGLPLYFRNSHGNKSMWEIDVASAGPDRRGDPRTHGLEHPPGSFQHHYMEQALGNGAFWLPDEFAAAKSAGHRIQTKFPRIDVMISGLPLDLRPQVRLDSLFREVVRMFSPPFCYYWRSGAVASFKQKFDALCDPSVDGHELSRHRLALLKDFVAEIGDSRHWEMERIRRDILDFSEQQSRNPTWPERLAAEDEEALASLAE